MKKVLLSLLLMLLCSLQSFADHPGRWTYFKCYKWVDGELQLTVLVGPDYDPTTTLVPIWIIIPPATTPTVVLPSSSVPITAGYSLTYVLTGVPDPGPTYCYDATWVNWYTGSIPAELPSGSTYEKICPCSECDASFGYCVKESSGTFPWDVTINMTQTPSTTALVYIDNNSPVPTYLTNTFNLDHGFHKICVNILGASDEEDDVLCSYCVDICLGEQNKSARKESNVLNAQLNKTIKNLSGVKIFPNPANNMSRMEFTLQQDDQITIELIDISGRVIRTIKNENAAKGYHAVDINTSGISAGTYIVRMKTGNAIANYRLSVIK